MKVSVLVLSDDKRSCMSPINHGDHPSNGLAVE